MKGIENIENNQKVLLSEVSRPEYFPIIMEVRNERYLGQYTLPDILYPGIELVISKNDRA